MAEMVGKEPAGVSRLSKKWPENVLLPKGQVVKTVLEWTFETHQTAFSLPLLPPDIPGDPRLERRNAARCFL